MVKTYIPDPSVYLSSPRALLAFEDNKLIIPSCVLQEMAAAASEIGPYRANAVEFNQLLDSLFDTTEKTALLANRGKIELYISEDNIFTAAKKTNSIIVSRKPSVCRPETPAFRRNHSTQNRFRKPPRHIWADVICLWRQKKWLSLPKTKN